MIAGMIMALNAPRANPIQRAINILKSAGPGAWYDPSDLTTLYQDSAGTTPVTAVEQPVGLILDKSKGLVLGAELSPGGGTFDSADGWTLLNSNISGGALTMTTGGSGCRCAPTNYTQVTGGKTYVVSFEITSSTANYGLRILNYTSVKGSYFPEGGNYYTAAGKYHFVLKVQETGGIGFDRVFSHTGTVVVDNISVRELPGAHLIQPTATSRPTLKQDGNGMYCLHFDGIDDSLYSAASVDFTSTDKMTVFAGVHKASDAAAGILVESSSAPNSTAGTFTAQAPVGAGLASFGIWNAGTIQCGAQVSGATYAAPSTRVLTGVGDISGDLVVLRLNGAQVASAATDQGTGNYGNHVLYVGRRNNASLPFNGRLYQLALKGKAMTAAEISTVEAFFNSRTKAF